MTLQSRVCCCALTSTQPPFEDDDDWPEFDPASLESCILDDFDWDIEDAYPQRGDFPDDPFTQRELSD